MNPSSARSIHLWQRSGWGLWPRWVLANAMAGSIASFAGYYLNVVTASSGGPGLIVIALAISLTWAVVGIAQWLVLRNQIQKARAWILADIVGGLAGTILGWWISTGWGGLFTDTPNPALLSIGVIGGVAGGVLGLVQWRILRDRITNGRLWLLASAGSGVAGWIVGWGVSDRLGFFTASAAGWAAGAAITGFALMMLLPDLSPEIPR